MTTTTTPWARLPNAVHIDRVIASAIANPGQWNAAESEKWDVAWNATRDVLSEQGRYTEWSTASSTVWLARQPKSSAAVWSAVREALLALVAYDDCAYMIDSDPGELAILAKFGDRRAVLLLPACKVFHLLKEIV